MKSSRHQVRVSLKAPDPARPLLVVYREFCTWQVTCVAREPSQKSNKIEKSGSRPPFAGFRRGYFWFLFFFFFPSGPRPREDHRIGRIRAETLGGLVSRIAWGARKEKYKERTATLWTGRRGICERLRRDSNSSGDKEDTCKGATTSGNGGEGDEVF